MSTSIRNILVVCVIYKRLSYKYITLYLHLDLTGIHENLNAVKHSIKIYLL